MSDETKALVEQLEAWAPLVSSGYEVPAAGQTMMNASRTLTAQADEIERLRVALEWYANPEVYKPSPHGLAFDDRDLSYHALAALKAAQEVEA